MTGRIRRPRIAIVAARHLRENPYQILRLSDAACHAGGEPLPILVGSPLNNFGYTQEDAQQEPFRQAGAIWINRLRDYLNIIRNVDAVIIGCWKEYKWLVQSSCALGKLTIEADYFSGMDTWCFGSHVLLAKGPFLRNLTQRLAQLLYPDTLFEAVGSIAQEYPRSAPPLLSREKFYNKYRLDPRRRLAVFFPSWYPEAEKTYTIEEGKPPQDVSPWYEKHNREICRAVHQAGLNLIIKLHPNIFASWRQGASAAYLREVSDYARILEPTDTFECLKYLDVGISILSHSAMDVNYWRHPFIYVDSDIAPFPTNRSLEAQYEIEALVPCGPSTRWGQARSTPRYSLRSWVGAACRLNELTEVLETGAYEDSDPEHYNRIIEAYWSSDDGKAGDRIIEYTLDSLDKYRPRRDWRRLVFIARDAWSHKKF